MTILRSRVAVVEDVAVHGDVADLGVLDRLAVLGVTADRPVMPQRRKTPW